MKSKVKFASATRSADCQSAVSRIGNLPGSQAVNTPPKHIRRHGRLTICATLVASAPVKVFACAACYGGNVDSAMTEGMNWGILTLLGVIVPVLGAFLTFLIYAIRKSEALTAAAEQKNSPEASNV